jgi:dynein regulatory complex protein 1
MCHWRTHQGLRAQLLTEAETSAAANTAIAMRWSELRSLSTPQDLLAAMEEQRGACEAVIASKGRLVAGTCL